MLLNPLHRTESLPQIAFLMAERLYGFQHQQQAKGLYCGSEQMAEYFDELCRFVKRPKRGPLTTSDIGLLASALVPAALARRRSMVTA